MATIDIRRPHSLPIDDAKKRAEDLARGMQDRFGVDWRWEGDVITFEARAGAAKGTKGKVSVSASEVRVEIDLPLMLRMMKGTIESKVTEKLAAAL